MSGTDEKFFAWLDGELDPRDAAEMAARVAGDPRLARLAEQHRALGNRLRGAFEPVGEAPMPERLQAALRAPSTVTRLPVRPRARPFASLPNWAALAASLALGLFFGVNLAARDGSPVEAENGKLFAAASLAEALDTQLASAPGAAARIGVTFRDRSGTICRSFTQGEGSGLACRDDGRWQLRGLFSAPGAEAGEYRMAAGMDPQLGALIDSTIAGEPFDAAAEERSKARGWR